MKSLFIYLFTMLSFAAFLGISEDAIAFSIPLNYETLEQWKLIAPDEQTFVLVERQFDSRHLYSVGFFKGPRTFQTTPAAKENWTKWRSQFAHMIESYPTPKSCPHPYRFVVEKKNQAAKEKEFCFSELKFDEQKSIQKLVQEFEGLIDGT